MRKLSLAASVALFAAIVIPSTASAAWPVASRSAYVSQWFSSHHPAIDIAAPAGSHIVPIGNGTVVFAGYKANCGGYQVWVRNHDVYSAYYHMSHIWVHRGQVVTGQRTTLGLVGQTGCATGPHVHVEVWTGYPWASGSHRVNPWPYIDQGVYLPLRY
jgi:murein DD-endopeptidase MepM/ murein hydrolase activator NlpD